MLLLFIDTILSSTAGIYFMVIHRLAGPEVHKPQLLEGDIQILISNFEIQTTNKYE